MEFSWFLHCTHAERSERRRKQKKTKIKVLLVDMKVTAIVC